MQGRISKRTVDDLEPGQQITDNEIHGFVARRLPSGTVTYALRYTNASGRARYLPLGLHGSITPDQARTLAKKRAGEIADDKDPAVERQKARAAGGNTLKAVLESYMAIECGMKRDADGKATFHGKVRSAPQKLDAFERLIYPAIGNTPINDLTRLEINQTLDKITKESGPVMADRALAHLRRALNWYAVRTDDFRSPIVKGMARTKPKQRAGKRVLADDEIRDIWAVCERVERESIKDLPAAFSRFQRSLFLAACRRTEAAAMSWFEMESLARDDFTGDAWICPGERMKGGLDHLVPITTALRNTVGEQPKDWRQRPYVFSTTGGKRPFSGYSKAKRALDRELAALRKREGREPMRPWTMQRDVRRTARTLLPRAGVPKEIAERVLAHEMPGVEGVYNRYEYVAEKSDALTKLAALIGRIVHPPGENVVSFVRQA
jgi:integrase